MMRFFICVVLMLAFILGAIWLEGGRFPAFFAPTTFAVVLLVPFISTFAVWGFPGIGKAFRSALGKVEDAKVLGRSLIVWDFFEKTTYAAGLLGFILGIILVLTSITEPRTIGKPLSFCFLSLIYGFFFGIVARILRARVEENSAG
ncbi:MAG TPA: hypothetical protein VMU36_08020 [Spirochaetia bacterium]|nr:hypothetical protein [Spirochaetia bacterium]